MTGNVFTSFFIVFLIKVKPLRDVYFVTTPLMGHEFRFADRSAAKRGQKKGMDLGMHVDPLMALGKASVRKLGKGRLEDFDKCPAGDYAKAVWGVRSGDVIAVRTNQGKLAVVEVVAIGTKQVSFRFRVLPAAATADP